MRHTSNTAYEPQTNWLRMVYLWVIWTLAAAFFFYKYLIQVSPSVMTEELMEVFHVNGMGLGNLSAFYFYAYLIMQIPVGVMLDRYSPRLLTTCAILLCSISTYVFSQTNELWMACFSRAFMGVGAAFAAVSCFKLASVWFPPKRFALVSGMFMTAAMLGAVGGQMPLSLLVQHVGWRMGLEIISGIGLLLGVVYFLVVRDKKINLTHTVLDDHRTPWERFLAIITSKQAWVLSLYSGLAFAPISVFGGLWGVPFLQIAYKLSRTDAAFAVSCIFIGFAAGAPFWGWLSDYLGRRKPILFFGTFLAFLALVVILYVPNQHLLMLIAFLFTFGFCSSGFFTSFAMIRELFTLVVAATVLGIMNTLNAVFEAVFEPLVGVVLDWTWDGKVTNGLHMFSIHGYHVSLALLPLSLLIALITLLGIKETYCSELRGNDSDTVS